MSSLALPFAVAMFNKEPLSMQFMTRCHLELEELAKTLGIEISVQNLKYFLKLFHRLHDDINKYYQTFAHLGSVEWTQKMIDLGANQDFLAIFKAARSGHLEVVKIISHQQEIILSWAALEAAACGKVEIVRYAHEQGRLGDEIEFLRVGCAKSQVNVVRYILGNMKINKTDLMFQWCRRTALNSGNEELKSLFR